MFGFQEIWITLTALIGLIFWAFILWLAWLLVTSIRGMHSELTRIRELLAQIAARPRE